MFIHLPMRNILLWSLLLMTLFTALKASAADATLAERDTWNADTRGVLPKMAHPPNCDGVIHPEEWAQAAEFSAQLSQGWGIAGHHFFPRTVIWHLGWDAQNLYLASRTVLLENERPRRNARSNVGSEVMSDDTLEMWLDPKGRNAGNELASYFQGMVNTLGITYYARLYPSVGAKTDTWDPHWKIGASINDQYMDIEITMPNTGFGLAQPNKTGDTWGIMLARNFMFQNWNQSPMAYEFPNFGFAVNSYYPLMTLDDAAPYVKFRCPLELYQGKAVADADIINPGATAQRVRTLLTIGTVQSTFYKAERLMELPANGHLDYHLNEALNPAIDLTKSAVYKYSFTVTSEDGKQELFHTHFAFDPMESRDWLKMKFRPAPELTANASFNPVRSKLQSSVDVIDFPQRNEITAVKTVVTDGAGKVLAESRTDKKYRDMYGDLVQCPPLATGKYAWKASVLLKDGTEKAAGEGTFEKKDETKSFPWWNYNGGNAEKVLWPFTAVKVEKGGQVLKAWGNELQLDGLALPAQIIATGNTERWPQGRSGNPAVLAEPVHLDAVIGGKATRFKASGKPKLVSAADYRLMLSGSTQANGVQISTATRFEQDGSYFIDLTLAPAKAGKPVTIDSLDLSIPLRDDVATFLNAYAHCGYSGYFIDRTPIKALAGATSAKRYAVWEPALCGAPTVTAGDFIPQIWLGNEFRGLLWYADSDSGWTPTDGKRAQQIDREGNKVILIHHLINVPTELKAPRTISFVMQPTPQRPLQPGWRMLNSSFSQSFMDASSYGRNSLNYSASINLNGDAAYAKSLEYSKRFTAFKGKHPNQEMYFAPHTESSAIMTTDWPARGYFGGEWEGGTYNKTLNDHTLWYVNKWVEQGGIQSLYHDQFSPHKVTSVSSGLAYFLHDGRVQPGFALTTRRDYVMREHALWMEKGIIPPRTLTHTTNGGPLASYSWVDSCVDGEDKQINKNTPLDFADTWPSDRLRAGSIAYNWGVTFSWMRLFDGKGMSKEEVDAHARIYAGHCLMHDVMNAYMWTFAPNYSPQSPLLAWGMDDERVCFWPFWSNSDAVKQNIPDVKVSAWTLPDRVMLCVFNYSKEKMADSTVTLDLKKLGVVLPAEVRVINAEKPAQSITAEINKDTATLHLSLGKRDYLLVSIAAGK